jgi:hypothetical protein
MPQSLFSLNCTVLDRLSRVKKLHIEFHENPTNGITADTKSQM